MMELKDLINDMVKFTLEYHEPIMEIMTGKQCHARIEHHNLNHENRSVLTTIQCPGGYYQQIWVERLVLYQMVRYYLSFLCDNLVISPTLHSKLQAMFSPRRGYPPCHTYHPTSPSAIHLPMPWEAYAHSRTPS